ncbi:MAG: serine hydrolase domain-containing protein [Bacteroidia bacterium]|nr:serine hydrolase domain-containing protein [Bacteroidia bacterium]
MLVKQNIFCISIFLWVFCHPFASSAQENELDYAAIDERIDQVLDSTGIPGFSISIINAGQSDFLKSYGYRSMESKEAVDQQTRFEAASLTKPILAYWVLKLMEQEKIELDKPLYQYLEYADLAHDKRYKLITARMVLSHTTGLPNWRKDRNSPKLKLRRKPGSKFGYSGEGFVYLQKVVEHILESDLNSIAHEFIFSPLNMENSSMVFEENGNYALGHNKAHTSRKKSKPNKANAAYSLQSTAEDYGKFLQELLNPEFIDKALVEQAFSIQSLMKKEDPSLGWGLGMGINQTAEDQYIWHWGDNGVFKAFFIFSPIQQRGFVYFSNSQIGLSIVKRLIKWVFLDKSIMENWQYYSQF